MFREGPQIGPYTLVRKLGNGGFGAVWLAERRSQFLTKKVAVKLPHDEQVNFETIRREATLWEEASGHPNVLPIIDADVYDGQVVIVSEFADGGSLAEKLTDVGTTSIKDAAELTIGILSGLEFLHQRRIIHRDIKPQNILIQGGTPRLADFGISRAMQTTAISSTIIGTDAYMSPEAFDGKRSVQTDIWSVGVVLYQLLNGTLPFPQEHPSERMFAVLTKEFAPLSSDVPADLRSVVQKALQKQPEDRYASAAEMREDLSRALNRLNNPTQAVTEVFDAASLATAPGYDPDATVVRQPEAPPVVEASPVPFVAGESVVTRVEVPVTVANAGTPAGDKVASSEEMSPAKIVGVAAAIIVVVGLFAMILAGLSSSSSKNKGVDVSISPKNNSSAYNSNYSAYNANVSNSTYNSNYSSSNYSSNANSPPSNNYSVVGNQKIISTDASFCEGWVFGWNDTYKKKYGESYTPPTPPICPDPTDYRESLRNGFGGQLVASIEANRRISGTK